MLRAALVAACAARLEAKACHSGRSAMERSEFALARRLTNRNTSSIDTSPAPMRAVPFLRCGVPGLNLNWP
jgi:hypothetical protein